MTNVYETIDAYEASCKHFSVGTNDYIMHMLEREKDNPEIDRSKDPLLIKKYQKEIWERQNVMDLYIAGNYRQRTEKPLEDEDIKPLCKSLQSNLFVETLDLRYNRITDAGAEYIAEMIREINETLRNVNLMCNEIGDQGAKAIAKALEQNVSIRIVRMNGNKIGNAGGMYFAQMLQVNESLEYLDLADCDLTIESIIALATVLRQNTSLKALNVNRPILFTHQEETTVHFANMLKVNRSLQELHVAKYDLRDFGACRLAENLLANLSLRYLNLSSNRVTRDGMLALSKWLKQDTPLEVLDLSNNRLEDDGARHLAEALSTFNTHLKVLAVRYNNIHGPGLCALADSLKFNSSLTHVYIWGNKLEESACIAFQNLIETGRLKPEHTDVKPYVVDDVTYLCEVNQSPRMFYYWHPVFGDDVPPKLSDWPQ